MGLTKSKKISLLTALLVAIEPWGLFLSRSVVQSNLSVFFLTAAFAALVNRGKARFLLPVGILFLGLTLYSYHTTRIVTPILTVLGFLIYRKSIVEALRKDRRVAILTIGLFLIFFLPLPFLLGRPEASARSKFTFILSEATVAKIEETRNNSTLPPLLKTLVFNRPSYFVGQFLGNYFDYFSPKYLFLQGGTQYQMSVPGKGLLYPASLLFFYLGLFWVAQKAIKKGGDYRLIFFWLLVSPIPAAITTEPYAVVRASAMLPLPMILSSLGLVKTVDWLKARFGVKLELPLYIVFFIALAFFAAGYLKQYFTSYKKDYSWSWQYGYKQVAEYAKANYPKYDKIIVSKKYGEPHEFFLFFWPWDPASYQKDPNLVRFYQSGWFWVDSYDKLYFVNDWQIVSENERNFEFVLESGKEVDCQAPQKCLLITSPDNYPNGWTLLEKIYFLDGKEAFEMLDNSNTY
jgi:hypothetical protein